MPVCATGGFVYSSEMDQALQSGACDMVGMGRPFIIAPRDTGDRLEDGGEVRMEPIVREAA